MMAIGYDDGQTMFSNQELQEVSTNMNTKHRVSKEWTTLQKISYDNESMVDWKTETWII